MSNQRLVYTKQIKGGKLKASDMEMGSSVSGIYKGMTETDRVTKDGRTFKALSVLLDVRGNQVEVFASGNLKYIKEKVTEGDSVVITRIPNAITKRGFETTQFDIRPIGSVDAVAPAAVTTAAPSVKEQLAAIQAKRN